MPDRGKLEAIGKAATIGIATYIVTKVNDCEPLVTRAE
jgi:hypothetical protein